MNHRSHRLKIAKTGDAKRWFSWYNTSETTIAATKGYVGSM
jgi:hypothetical protein